MTRKCGGRGFGGFHVLSVICALGIVVIFILVRTLPPVQKPVQKPVSALIYTPTGKVSAKVGDLMRVKHKDQYVSRHATPEGLYVIWKITNDLYVGPVISFKNPSFPDGLPIGANSLQAESHFIEFAICKPSQPEYEGMKTEFENLALTSNTSTHAAATDTDSTK